MFKTKTSESSAVRLNSSTISSDAGNWWYHYESRGSRREVVALEPVDLTLGENKLTPDFANRKLDCAICHPQILADLTPGQSVIVLKTSAGIPASAYVVGYAKVAASDGGVLSFDRNDSVLLLDNPLVLDAEWCSKLIPDDREGYWDDDIGLSSKIGSKTRNRKIESEPLIAVVEELNARLENGGKNYMGSTYASLMQQNKIQYSTSTMVMNDLVVPTKILEALAVSKFPLTVRQISASTGFPKCKVKPWVKTLEARGRIVSGAKRGAEKLYGISR